MMMEVALVSGLWVMAAFGLKLLSDIRDELRKENENKTTKRTIGGYEGAELNE